MPERIKELENEIKYLRERLQYAMDILDKAPCFLYINEIGNPDEDNSMRNIYLNQYAMDQTGCSVEEASAMGALYFKKIMHPDDFEVIDQSIEFLKYKCDDKVFGGLYKFKSKNGDYRWHIGRCRVFRKDEKGDTIQFINAGIDLQEEFHSHNQVIELLKENKRLVNELTILKLTKREKDVLKLLAIGDCARVISKKLHISESTVISHRKNMLKKLKLHSTASLVHFAVENGLN